MRRHETDPVSFTAGLLFSAIGLTYLLPQVSDIEIETPWVVPALVIGLGVCGLLSALTSCTPERADGPLANPDAPPEPYVDYDPEPFPDLTLDLAEELAKSTPSPPPPPPPDRPRRSGAHAINPDDPDADRPA